jgi:hypothetical protein
MVDDKVDSLQPKSIGYGLADREDSKKGVFLLDKTGHLGDRP